MMKRKCCDYESFVSLKNLLIVFLDQIGRPVRYYLLFAKWVATNVPCVWGK